MESWEQQSVAAYVYHYKCNAAPTTLDNLCGEAWKHSLVFDGDTKCVEYDPLESSKSDLDCSNDEIIYEIEFTIDAILVAIIDELQKRLDSLNGIGNERFSCDAELSTATIEHDSHVHYHKQFQITNPASASGPGFDLGCYTSVND